ncbi:MAG: hypothetical protein NVSMB68_07240 [Thermoanaerobaculia bacterium]
MRRALGAFLFLTACATAPRPVVPAFAQNATDDEARTTIASLRDAVRANPADGPRIYLLAQYLDRTGDTAEAMQWLGELERLGWRHGINEHDFVRSARLSRYRSLAARLNAREPHIVRSRRAFVIGQRDLLPEGIAWDGSTGDFYVSSIYLRKVIRVRADGTSSDFVREGQDGLLGTLGLKVDTKRRLLWVVSNAAREMEGFTDAMDGLSTVHAYDLVTGKLATKISFGSRTEPSLLNDLVVLDDGSVLITDNDGGDIMRVRLGSESIESWIPEHTFTFPNGIAVADGEPFVYVADFNGLSRVDARSRTITPLPVPQPGETLSGIDGLVSWRGSLIGIQNGVGRPRVIRVDLNEARDAISGTAVIEAGNPLFDEPTRGVVAGDEFLFMANPQLRAFDENHRIWPRERLHDIVVLRLPLD